MTIAQISENHSGDLRRENAEQIANRLITEEMVRIGWHETQLSCRLKNDPGKLLMAARIRKETALPIKWIAARFQMGTAKNVKPSSGVKPEVGF